MTVSIAFKAAGFLLCCATAFAGLRAATAVLSASTRIRLDRLPAYFLNSALPNPDDRDTAFDYVDQSGWAAVSAAKMWGCLAGLSLLGAATALLLAP